MKNKISSVLILMLLFLAMTAPPLLSREVTYTYDNMNRLISAAYAEGSNTKTINYGYDPAGNLLSSTLTSGSAATGSVVVNPSPDSLSAPWTLTGPNSYSRTGNGDATLTNLNVGDYTVTWGDVTGWLKPAPASVTKAVTNGGTTTFTGVYNIALVILAVPVLSSPADNAAGQPGNVSLLWLDTNSNPGEAGYKVRIKPAGGNYTEYKVSRNVTSWSSNLSPGVTYHWSVKSVGDGMTTQDSAYPADWYFTVIGATLKVPTLSSPAEGASGQPLSVTLKWVDTNSSPQETGYKVRIKPSGDSYTEYDVAQNFTSLTSRLAAGTKYYWSVKTVGNGTTTLDSTYPSDRSFIVAVPMPGDVNCDGVVTIADAILSMQIISGLSPVAPVYHEADVNNDGRLGHPELIFILQKVAGMR